MSNTNAIGISNEKAIILADKLNGLLSNYSIFYQNVRGYHWNIRGNMFFELHLKFEELYNALILNIDEIAERILTLGYTPLHKYSDYRTTSIILERTETKDGPQAISNILESLKSIILLQRELLTLSADANDEGTISMMSDYIRNQEKLVWMYSAYLD